MGQTWENAYEKAGKRGFEIELLFERFMALQGILMMPTGIEVLDINAGVHEKGSAHYENKGVDFCFVAAGYVIENSAMVAAAIRAGFRGIGVYKGKGKRSYHVDLKDRWALWTAEKGKNGKWEYTYFDKGVQW